MLDRFKGKYPVFGSSRKGCFRWISGLVLKNSGRFRVTRTSPGLAFDGLQFFFSSLSLAPFSRIFKLDLGMRRLWEKRDLECAIRSSTRG